MPEEPLSPAPTLASASAAPAAAAARPTPDPPAKPAAAGTTSRSDRANGLLAKYGLLGAFLLTIVVFSLARPDTFPTMDNAKSILTVAAPSLIVAAGLTVVLVMQDFDLSFGAMIGLAGGTATSLAVHYGWSWQLALVAALVFGVAAGVINGYIVAYLGGSSFIITLAMGTVLTGVEFALTGQNTVYSGVSDSYAKIAGDTFLGLSNQIWIAAVIALVIWVLLDRSEIGRYMYAIGGNPEAAELSGVRVRLLRTFGFVVVGVAAAVVGILITSESAAYNPNAGTSYLLPAFAAAFLGSAVFRPGEFNLPGTVVGVLFLGVIQTGLTMLDFETYAINLVQGGILISAVLVSRLGQRAR
jgi:ribose transport system permease protein